MRILHVHAGVAGVVSHQPVMKQETGDETRLLHCQARSESVEKVTCSTSGKLGGELKIRNGSLYQKLSDQIGSFEGNPLFPTCQVRVVRFYQRCSPHPPSPPPPPPPLPPPPVSPRPCLHQLPRPLPPCQLVANLVANFRAQWALLDLNCWLPIWVGAAGPQPPSSERSGHRWTSTTRFWAGTAGPQLPASEPSGHCLTSTWDLQSSVGTAGPQPGTFRAQWAAR